MIRACYEISETIILKKKIYIKIKEIYNGEWEIRHYFIDFLRAFSLNNKIKKYKQLTDTIQDIMYYFIDSKNKSYSTIKLSVDRLCSKLTPDFEISNNEEYLAIKIFFEELYDF
jgi:hypothetical protein